MDLYPDIARVAAVFADQTRSRILVALTDGRSLPASRLAEEAGVSASTVSGHLRQLLDQGLLGVEEHGRHRYYRIVDPRVMPVIEALLTMTPTPQPTGLTGHNRMLRLRAGRTCYDHAAGTLGTDIMAGLVELDVLVRTDGQQGSGRGEDAELNRTQRTTPYVLGGRAGAVLAGIGVDLAALERSRRPLLRVCMDWTEQRHHLAGNLGAAVLTGLLERGWVEQGRGLRELRVLRPDEIDAWLHSGVAA